MILNSVFSFLQDDGVTFENILTEHLNVFVTKQVVQKMMTMMKRMMRRPLLRRRRRKRLQKKVLREKKKRRIKTRSPNQKVSSVQMSNLKHFYYEL